MADIQDNIMPRMPRSLMAMSESQLIGSPKLIKGLRTLTFIVTPGSELLAS